MSRPFSYNDKNFTVIGNVLFCHIKYEDSAPSGKKLIEIPPAIGDRLLFFSSVGFAGFSTLESTSHNTSMSVVISNKKFYLTNKTNLNAAENRFLCGIFMLKDI